MIKKCVKVDYKQKCIKFEDDKIIDENGEVLNLEKDLKKVFSNREFTLTATCQKSDEFDVDDFNN